MSGAVSVIIPCYNAAAYVEETLGSVYSQEGVEVEVIVIDDGSTDDSARLVASHFPQARLERTPNQGPSAARNLGTSLTTAPFIQYLDADDFLGAGKLASQVRLLEETGADVAYGDWVRYGADKQETVSWRLGPTPDLDLFLGFWCPPAAYLLRRKIVDATGGWNPRLPVIQDARFMLDCALHGARFVHCPGIMGYYRTHQSGSVSTRSGVAFWRDCLTNAIEVHEWWSAHGMLDEPRRIALARVCRQIATTSYRRDPDRFRGARELLIRVAPNYVPADQPWRVRIASRVLGAGHALSLESYLRQCKSAVLTK